MTPFDQVLTTFSTATSSWQPIVLFLAQRLFIILAVIQISWAGITWMIEKDDPRALFIDFVKKIITIFFFWTILVNYQTLIPIITDSLRLAGTKMLLGVGVTIPMALEPNTIFEKGVQLASAILTTSNQGGFFTKIGAAIIGAMIAGVIFFAFIRIAIEAALILIGGQIILVGGIIMLGFSGAKWTMHFAERYLTAVVHIGLKLLFITLIIGLGETVSGSWITIINNATRANLLDAYFSVLGASLIYLFIAIKVPDMAASLLTGSFGMNMGEGVLPSLVIGTAALASGLKKMGSTVSGMVGGFAKGAVGAGTAIVAASKMSGGSQGASNRVSNTIKTLSSAGYSYVRDKVKGSISQTSGGQVADRIRMQKGTKP